MNKFTFWIFKILLKKYCREVDQWDLVQVEVDGYKFYISFSSSPLHGEDKHYRKYL